jgi:hypothetical protein
MDPFGQTPYLICGFDGSDYIHSYAKDVSIDAQNEMFKNFITKLIKNKDLKYVYAHNLSGFDGILLLKHIISYEGVTVEPLVFNGKLMSIKLKIAKGKSTRVVIFKDSYLLLSMSLRRLCKSFKVEHEKGYFPFTVTNINYKGNIPDFEYWTDLSLAEYKDLSLKYKNKDWSFKNEAIKYCKLDCKCLYDVLVKFNDLIFKEFNVNIHSSLTLPSLTMRIFR